MDKLLARIKQEWEKNPLQTAATGALVVTALAKLLDAVSNQRRSRAWDREVSRRDRISRRR